MRRMKISRRSEDVWNRPIDCHSGWRRVCRGREAPNSFELTTPGGSVKTGGSTAIAVVPTHRRRGILTEIMRYHFDDVRSREEPLSVLRASESTIYSRFPATRVATVDTSFQIERQHAGLATRIPTPGLVRLVEKDEARRNMPGIYERLGAPRPEPSVAPEQSGMCTCSIWSIGGTA